MQDFLDYIFWRIDPVEQQEVWTRISLVQKVQLLKDTERAAVLLEREDLLTEWMYESWRQSGARACDLEIRQNRLAEWACWEGTDILEGTEIAELQPFLV